MLNLEELVFKVNTKELVDAVTDLKSLSQAVTDLGTKSASVNVKVNKTTAEVKSQAKAVKEATEETNKSTAALQRQQDILNFMTQGFSKGQSSVLAYAKAAGAATSEITELGKVLDRQRTLMGTDPFDKSIGAMKALKNEYTVLREVNRLYNAELNLSKNQMNELAREKLRLIEKLKIEGKSFTDVKNALRDLNIAYIQNANAENTLDANMRRRQKTTQDTAKANEYLAKEMDRVNRMLGNTDNITSTTNNKLIRFEQELKRSGMTAAQQTVALEKYKKALLEIQQAGGNRQVDYLSRALGPQITDIFVGLSTGQSPLMVLLQQGGQLRDQFALAGVAGAEMGNMLTTAAKSMVTSVKDISIAVGQLLLNAIKGVGVAILDFFVAPFKLAKAAMIDFIYNGNAVEAQMARLQAAAAGFARTAAVLASILGGALLIALFQISTAQDDFVRALYQSGASMDLNKDSATAYALSMEKMGVSSTKAMQALTEIAKAGGFTKDSIEGIITAAISMEKYAGVSIGKTVENFKKLQDKPSEALIEIAKNTGYLTVEQLKQIKSFEDVGDRVTAAKMAMEAYSDISNKVAAQIQANLSPMERAFIDMKASVVGVWHEFKTWAQESELLAASLKGLGWVVQAAALGFKVFKAILSGATWPELRDSLSKDAEALRNYFDETKSGVTGLDAATREYNANAVRGYQNQVKLADELKDKLDPQKMTKGAFVAAKMQEVLSKTGASFESPAQMQKAISKYTQEWVDGQKKGNKEVNELERYMKRIKESVRDVRNDTDNLGKQEVEITKAAKLRADLMDDDLWGKVPKVVRDQLLDELGILDTKERQFKQQEKHQKIVEEEWKKTIERQKEVDKLYFDISDNLSKQSEALQESGKDLEFQYSLLGKSDEEVKNMTREYERQNKLRKAFLDYEKTLADIRNLPTNEQESLRLQAEEQYANKVRQINSETALMAAQDYEKAFKDIQNVVSDIIATALFEGGKAGQQKLKDVLKNAFRNFVINVLINPIIGGGMNSILSIGGKGNIGSNIADAANNYLTNTALGSLLTSTGGYAAAIGGGSIAAGSQAAMLAAQTAEFGVAGTALTAQAAGSTTGGIASSVMNGLSAIPGWGWAAMAVGALLASGFGKTPGEQHTGAMISTRGSDLDMATAMSITGGREGASRDLTTRYNADLAKAIKPVVEGAMTGVNSALTGLGMGGYTIDAGFAANTNGKGKNKNAFGYFNIYDEAGNIVKEYVNRELGTDLTAAIQKFGGDIQEAVASVVLEGSNFKREGETNAQTLNRLSTSLTAVNQVIDLLGGKSIDLSLAGGDAASSLVDLFGSIENLKSASQSFYDKFANDTIKLADAQELLNTTFNKLGLSLPKTKDEYFKLVKGLDLTTEAGRNAYASLLGVSDAFLDVENTVGNAEKALDDASSALESSVKREQDMLAKRVTSVEAVRNSLSKLFDLLSDAVRELYSSVPSTATGVFSQARKFITDSVVTARTGGGLPDADKLQEALSTVRTGISTAVYSTRFEQERDTLILAGELSELQGYAGENLSNVELQLKELKDQSEQFDMMLEAYKTQIDIAKGIDTSILSVAEAINKLTELLSPKTSTTGGTSGGTKPSTSGSSGSGGFVVGGGSGGSSSSIYDTEAERLAANIAAWESSGKDWKAVYLPSGGLAIVGDSSGKAVTDQEKEWLKNAGVPGFANGGAFTNGIVKEPTFFNMAQMGEKTPEAIMPLTNIGGSLGVRSVSDPSLVEAIAATNTNLELLRIEVKSIAMSSDKTRRLLERVSQDGNSLFVTNTA